MRPYVGRGRWAVLGMTAVAHVAKAQSECEKCDYCFVILETALNTLTH